MSLNRGVGNQEYMKKKIPKNAKYDHVKTKLDTGCSLTKYMERMEEIRKNYRYRKDEIFKRLKVTTFAQLVLQVASVSDSNESEIDDASQDPQDGLFVGSDTDLESQSEHHNSSPQAPSPSGDSKDPCHTSRSTLLSVISGVGELNMDSSDHRTDDDLLPDAAPADRPYPDCPYLLLDVREREQYDLCHIIGAHSFPIGMLSRTMNPYSREVLEYKNAPGKIIIVYDEDERIASQAATVMCERGVENLFMLCGGLKVIAQKFPRGLTTGCLPDSCLSPRNSSSRGRKGSGLQQPADQRWTFTPEELEQIQDQLEEILVPSNTNSRLSSRLSSGSAPSKASSRVSSSTSRGSSSRVQSSRPWK
ncbi:centrosomal protein of 41 kDa [Oryzias melastigma]|uniref:Centrosomal protein 41 n=1 Tax=Oryzias melastigma TaxID=30732 RepID=A0A3B3BMX7_ORYME|nr:centrosomal protein of 41 kDa [Oryzias melastigma]